MMGHQPPSQENIFMYSIHLENRVRKDHILRSIKELIDFDFIYKEVEDTYGKNGNVSAPPPVILKLIFLFFFYNARSERELMETLPERLDWLWFLGYTLESPIPDHSVLSKARARWGEKVFKDFFERIVVQCVEKGLVDGTKIFMDASLIDANASRVCLWINIPLRNTLMMVIWNWRKDWKKKKAKSIPAISLPPIQMLQLFAIKEARPDSSTKPTGLLMPSMRLLLPLK